MFEFLTMKKRGLDLSAKPQLLSPKAAIGLGLGLVLIGIPVFNALTASSGLTCGHPNVTSLVNQITLESTEEEVRSSVYAYTLNSQELKTEVTFPEEISREGNASSRIHCEGSLNLFTRSKIKEGEAPNPWVLKGVLTTTYNVKFVDEAQTQIWVTAEYSD